MSLFITFFFMPLSSSIVKNCSKASPSGMTETRRMTAQRQEKITIEVFMVCLSVETLGVLVWKSKWIKDDDSRRSDDEQDLSREFKYFQVSGDFETSDNFFLYALEFYSKVDTRRSWSVGDWERRVRKSIISSCLSASLDLLSFV